MKHKNGIFNAYTPGQKFLDLLSLLVIVGTLVFTAVQYPSLPDSVPNQIDFHGNVTSYGSKGLVWLIPIMEAVFWLIMSTLPRFRGLTGSINVPWKMASGSLDRASGTVITFLLIINLELCLMFSAMALPLVLQKYYLAISWGGIAMTPVMLLTVALFLVRLYKITKKPAYKEPWEM